MAPTRCKARAASWRSLGVRTRFRGELLVEGQGLLQELALELRQ